SRADCMTPPKWRPWTRFTCYDLAALVSVVSAQKIQSKSSPPNELVMRLLHAFADTLSVNRHQAAAPLANFSGDEYRLDVARIHQVHDDSRRIVQRPDIETIGPQDDDICFFARTERADLAVEISATSPLDGRKFEDVATRQQRRQVLLAIAPALQHEITLRDGGQPHDREEIRRERHGVIRTE